VADLPEFDLAPLTEFTPRVIRPAFNDTDGFMLSFALAFNDFKTANWLLQILRTTDPEPTAVNGQISGMRIHAVRLIIGILHELLIAIETAQDNKVFDDATFKQALSETNGHVKADWQALLNAALGDKKDPFLKLLVGARNSVVSHYYQPWDLHAGYVGWFFRRTTDGFNQWAYASLGESMEQSRFYFADAAAAMAYDNPTSDVAFMAELNEYIPRINVTLRFIVGRYLELRHMAESGGRPA
jgi:hypothetical protein